MSIRIWCDIKNYVRHKLQTDSPNLKRDRADTHGHSTFTNGTFSNLPFDISDDNLATRKPSTPVLQKGLHLHVHGARSYDCTFDIVPLKPLSEDLCAKFNHGDEVKAELTHNLARVRIGRLSFPC